MVEVVAGFKVVCDLLVGVVRGYQTGKKEFFAAHVESLHQRMLSIHKDYIAGFEEAKRYLENDQSPPSAVIEFLEHRRRDYLAERELADNLAQELASADRRLVRDDVWTSVREYCWAIVKYFSAASEVGGISWYTDFLNSVKSKMQVGSPDVWNSIAISGSPRQDLLEEVRQILDVGLPRALTPINTYYAILRTRLL